MRPEGDGGALRMGRGKGTGSHELQSDPAARPAPVDAPSDPGDICGSVSRPGLLGRCGPRQPTCRENARQSHRNANSQDQWGSEAGSFHAGHGRDVQAARKPRAGARNRAGLRQQNLSKICARKIFLVYDSGKLQAITTFGVETARSRKERAEAAAKTQTGEGETAAGGSVMLPERFVALTFDDIHLKMADAVTVRVAAGASWMP